MKATLTDRRIAALKPQPGKRLELRDTVVPGLLVRVAAHKKTYYLRARFPSKPKNAVRRQIAVIGAITLEQARATAREWLDLIRKGTDPQETRRRAEAAAKRDEQSVFARVAADYLRREVSRMRTRKNITRIIENVLLPAWGDRPLSDISRRDVVALVSEVEERAPARARSVLAVARSMFNWARNRSVYDLEQCPTDRISGLVRPAAPRQRTLNDDELRAFWKATGRLGYPYGALFRLLLLTGTRKSEAAGARWSEFNFEREVWEIPAERFKSGHIHLVPITADVRALVDGLPHFRRGDYLFSANFGASPTLVLHAAKARLDRLMLRYLQALARLRGDDPAAVALVPFVIHDTRRVVRTRLAELGASDSIAELLIGHGKRGLARVYDQSQRLPQIRLAAEAWQAELRRIVAPAPPAETGKVVRLRG